MTSEERKITLKPETVPAEDAKKILNFLNTARTAEEIASKIEFPGKRDVGINVANNILDAREKIGKFKNLNQVDEIRQVGPERFSQIVRALGRQKIESERSQFRTLLLKNPNYFGNLPEFKIKPVKPMTSNTKYEQLRCIGFYPEGDILEAIIDIKLPYGYKGNLCSSGSVEYVRFFVDWNGDGDFEDPGEDVGIASVNVHNIPDTQEACLDKTKPLSYALRIKIDPKKHKCSTPNLVKVRAILSWDVPPPAANPNHLPVWGNTFDKWIQIAPQSGMIVLKDILDYIKLAELEKLNINTEMLNLDAQVIQKKPLEPSELKQIYKDKDVPEHRFNFSQVLHVAEKIKKNPLLKAKYVLDPDFSEVINGVDLVLAEKTNTKYEELKCVGLNYDEEALVATLTVKRPYGYSGNLCSDGSYEYVGFWAYVWDQIEQMCYWKYLGKSRVNVHDIANIPPEGLQYSVYLPVDFSNYSDECTKPKLLRVRAIMSWQSPPPTNNPYYEPVWGNKVDAIIQVKPRPNLTPGEQKPIIWAIGGMAVESISGNPYTTELSSIGDGYANGISLGGGFSALESPFGGVVRISGVITNAPNNPPTEDEKLRYKMQYRKYMAETDWHDMTNPFRIWIRKDGIPSGYIDQEADRGYYRYQKDLSQPIVTEVQDDVIAIWRTHSIEGVGGDGLYEVRVLLEKLGEPADGDCPANHVCSENFKVMVDNTVPTVEITLDSGPCEQFTPGSLISGTFKALDPHIGNYKFVVLPYSPPAGALTHTPSAVAYDTLAAPGVTSGIFALDTSEMKPCGYVIDLWVYDRTIVNNYKQGNRNHAPVGFCLLKKV